MQGWVVSVVFHGFMLTVALGLMAQVKQVVPKDPFTWDVALIEPQRIHETSEAEIKPTQEPAKPAPRQAASAPSKPKLVTQEVPTREVTPVVQREISQVVEASQPIEQAVEVQTRTETVEPVRPLVQHEAVTTSEPTMTASPMQQPLTTEAAVHPVESRAVETASVAHDPELPASPAAGMSAPSDAKPPESVARESVPQMAMATNPPPVVKADYGWLAESLRRRLAELKRYPSAARLNGWEGKVVLRAVIRADGHLSEVKVHKSSGHEALDNAAIESIRLACPLHLQQPIGTSELAIYVPIVYSLGS
jgi:protein TonB